MLPASLVGFLALHIYVFRRHGITARKPEIGPAVPFWPDQVLKDAVACLGVLAVVLLLAIFKGAELSAPADPAQAYAAARPEWYFLFLFRFLKFEWVEHYGLAFGAIYFPGAIMTIVLAMPLIAKKLGKVGHRFNVLFLALVSVGIIGLTLLAMVEDAANEDHQSAIAEAHRDGERTVELARGESRIPASGAGALLANDAFTQGPRIFAKHCASCHRFDGHNGRGRLMTAAVSESDERQVTLPEAADLGKFASREWMRAVLLDFQAHFAPIKLSGRYQNQTGDYFDPDNSEMADWSGEVDELRSPEQADDVNAIVEFLASEANHGLEQFDAALVARGRALAVDGSWNGALDGAACTNCHAAIGETFVEDATDDAGGYPDIRQYGSKAWLTAFLKDPGSVQFYGDKNQMPAFADKLSATELEHLTTWLTRTYEPTEVPPYSDRSPLVKDAVQERLSESTTAE